MMSAGRFIAELRRRRVFRVAVVYLGVGWLLIQVAATVPAALGLPESMLTVVIVLLAIGFPLAVGLAWAYDIEPDRVVRTPSSPDTPKRDTAAERAEAAGAIRSIAVLPFVNVSAEDDNEYFSDGITEELLTMLSRVGGLRVPGRTSVFALKGKDMDAREVGRHLDVAAVLAGSVRRAQNRLRITAELVDTATGYQLWSERYDREAGDIFAIQDDIARAIAGTLRIRLMPTAGADSLYRQPTSSIASYHEYLRGRYHLNRRTRASLRSAQEAFQKAILADPQFALAYSGLADAYLLLERYGVLPAGESIPLAEEAAQAALRIQPNLAEAHNSLAYAFMIGRWDWEAADREFLRAVELDPGYAPAHHWRSWHLARAGRFDEAIASIRRAQELEPLSLIINANVGTVLYFARRYEDAVEQLEKTLELNQDFTVALQWLGRAQDQLGMSESAVASQGRAAALLEADAECIASLGHALARNGQHQEAEARLEELASLRARAWISSYWSALILIGLGRLDEAVAALERACDERFDWIVFIGVDPVFDPLRQHPAFQRLVARIG